MSQTKLFKEILQQYKVSSSNLHHQGDLYEHSVWSALSCQAAFEDEKAFWVPQSLRKDVHFKRLCVIASYLHDIGKAGDRVYNFSEKLWHPKDGFSYLIEKIKFQYETEPHDQRSQRAAYLKDKDVKSFNFRLLLKEWDVTDKKSLMMVFVMVAMHWEYGEVVKRLRVVGPSNESLKTSGKWIFRDYWNKFYSACWKTLRFIGVHEAQEAFRSQKLDGVWSNFEERRAFLERLLAGCVIVSYSDLQGSHYPEKKDLSLGVLLQKIAATQEIPPVPSKKASYWSYLSQAPNNQSAFELHHMGDHEAKTIFQVFTKRMHTYVKNKNRKIDREKGFVSTRKISYLTGTGREKKELLFREFWAKVFKERVAETRVSDNDDFELVARTLARPCGRFHGHLLNKKHGVVKIMFAGEEIGRCWEPEWKDNMVVLFKGHRVASTTLGALRAPVSSYGSDFETAEDYSSDVSYQSAPNMGIVKGHPEDGKVLSFVIQTGKEKALLDMMDAGLIRALRLIAARVALDVKSSGTSPEVRTEGGERVECTSRCLDQLERHFGRFEEEQDPRYNSTYESDWDLISWVAQLVHHPKVRFVVEGKEIKVIGMYKTQVGNFHREIFLLDEEKNTVLNLYDIRETRVGPLYLRLLPFEMRYKVQGEMKKENETTYKFKDIKQLFIWYGHCFAEGVQTEASRTIAVDYPGSVVVKTDLNLAYPGKGVIWQGDKFLLPPSKQMTLPQILTYKVDSSTRSFYFNCEVTIQELFVENLDGNSHGLLYQHMADYIVNLDTNLKQIKKFRWKPYFPIMRKISELVELVLEENLLCSDCFKCKQKKGGTQETLKQKVSKLLVSNEYLKSLDKDKVAEELLNQKRKNMQAYGMIDPVLKECFQRTRDSFDKRFFITHYFNNDTDAGCHILVQQKEKVLRRGYAQATYRSRE